MNDLLVLIWGFMLGASIVGGGIYTFFSLELRNEFREKNNASNEKI